jgi:CRISPR/Cas system-associated exonuclease Cas4 (RecB family)
MNFPQLQTASVAVPSELIIILLILGAIIFLWDLLERQRASISKDIGMQANSKVVALRDSEELPHGELYDESLGIKGRPDAIIEEDGFFIPVNFLPVTKKIHDRHIIRLVAHLRLIELTRGQRPPYGTLLVGKKKRAVRVKNTDEKQEWLDNILAEMREVQNGTKIPIPAPVRYKCKNCDVRQKCKHSAYRETGTSLEIS